MAFEIKFPKSGKAKYLVVSALRDVRLYDLRSKPATLLVQVVSDPATDTPEVTAALAGCAGDLVDRDRQGAAKFGEIAQMKALFVGAFDEITARQRVRSARELKENLAAQNKMFAAQRKAARGKRGAGGFPDDYLGELNVSLPLSASRLSPGQAKRLADAHLGAQAATRVSARLRLRAARHAANRVRRNDVGKS